LAVLLALSSPVLAVDDLSLVVAAGSETAAPGGQVSVQLHVANLSAAINAAQALIHYDVTLLQLVDVVPTPGIGEVGWTEGSQLDTGGDIIYVASLNGGSTQLDHDIATLIFNVLAEGTTSIIFNPDNPPIQTKLVTVDNITILPNKINSTSMLLTCDDGNACTTDTLLSGVCQFTAVAAGTVCRASAGSCDVAETCDGTTAPCPVDGFVVAGTACGDATITVCDNADTCDSGGVCLTNPEPVTTECRASLGVCDAADFCDGVGLCDADAKLVTVCRAAAGDCDIAESCDAADFCDGVGLCDADAKAADGTVCDDTLLCTEGDVCTTGVCAGINPANRVTINVQVDALNTLATPLTRNVYITSTNCVSALIDSRAVAGAIDLTGNKIRPNIKFHNETSPLHLAITISWN